MPFRRSAVAMFMTTVGLCASMPASADPFSLLVTQPNSSNPNGGASQTLTFQQFDASLGTLTGVQFTIASLQGSVSSTVLGNFSSGEGGSASGTVQAVFSATGPGAVSLFSEIGNSTATCFTSNFSCQGTVPAALPAFGPVTQTAGLAAYIGAGTFDVDMLLGLQSTLLFCAQQYTGAGNCTASGSVSWDGDLSVEFLYRPFGQVPEPGTLALLALGAAGLGLRRRKNTV